MTQENTAKKPYYIMKVEAGVEYRWCSCGLTKTEPLCDSSHKGSGMKSVRFTPTETKDVFLCGCKKTKNPPFCDGTHKTLNNQ